MRKILFLGALITLVFSQDIFACQCAARPPFLSVAPKAEVIALVKVERYLTYQALETVSEKPMPMSMEVKVIDFYQGIEKKKALTVWGDNGILCRPYLSEFKVGRFYVIGFLKAKQTSRGLANKDENPNDYSISFCGEYWLSVDFSNKTARGVITEDQKTIRLKDLKHKLKKLKEENPKVVATNIYSECERIFNQFLGVNWANENKPSF